MKLSSSVNTGNIFFNIYLHNISPGSLFLFFVLFFLILTIEKTFLDQLSLLRGDLKSQAQIHKVLERFNNFHNVRGGTFN